MASSHNLTEQAYERIVRLLGRQPTLTEVGIFGVMYSEHCSYCSSKPYLKQFPTRGKRILVRAGEENAGLVDIGGGWAVAFKIESHNHPSAVEPHAGAATGVGGILRDIFTMGARPIALFDSLRFGPLNPSTRTTPPWRGGLAQDSAPRQRAAALRGHGRTRFLLDGVVKGIADYGNAVGVPTVGGEVAFDPSYRDNPLVNVMCIGLVRVGQVARARARGIGNPVLYVGSSTGRDGLGGASFASRELSEAADADRPAVQIGDPFAEKCLIEATLEALATGDVLGIQDMGAAGLTCSTSETAARGGVGIEIDVRRVPRRETGMTPYEVMLSESQERMLLIARKGREAGLKRIFARWGLSAVEIGRVTGDGRLRVKEGPTVVADIPARALTDGAPVYHRPTRRPRYLAAVQHLALRSLPVPKDGSQVLLRLLASPTIANKAAIFEQYDHMVQTNTAVLPARADAAVLRLKDVDRFLAATTDGSGRHCYLDPYEGGKLAVAEAARNLVCVGARPLAVTDCLNFGSPENPEVMWQFKECVRGIAEACRVLATPVTGGNVSFYNDGRGGAVDPTPVIGMIGLIEAPGSRLKAQGESNHLQPRASSLQPPLTASFKDDGDAIVLLGETREELGGSEYLAVIHGRKAGKPPHVNLQKERALHRVMLEAAAQGLLKSAHDCSDGGLAVALAECCLTDPDHLIGATVTLATRHSPLATRLDALLFGESAGRVVVSCEPRHADRVRTAAKRHGVPVALIGRVGGGRLVMKPHGQSPWSLLGRPWGGIPSEPTPPRRGGASRGIEPWIDVSVEALNEAWRTAIERALQAPGSRLEAQVEPSA